MSSSSRFPPSSERVVRDAESLEQYIKRQYGGDDRHRNTAQDSPGKDDDEQNATDDRVNAVKIDG